MYRLIQCEDSRFFYLSHYLVICLHMQNCGVGMSFEGISLVGMELSKILVHQTERTENKNYQTTFLLLKDSNKFPNHLFVVFLPSSRHRPLYLLDTGSFCKTNRITVEETFSCYPVTQAHKQRRGRDRTLPKGRYHQHPTSLLLANLHLWHY